jgi:hypothetical protein
MSVNCQNTKKNMARCTCTYAGCSRHGVCCECLHYHLAMKQLPACCFTPEAERTYDRSFRKFMETQGR